VILVDMVAGRALTIVQPLSIHYQTKKANPSAVPRHQPLLPQACRQCPACFRIIRRRLCATPAERELVLKALGMPRRCVKAAASHQHQERLAALASCVQPEPSPKEQLEARHGWE